MGHIYIYIIFLIFLSTGSYDGTLQQLNLVTVYESIARRKQAAQAEAAALAAQLALEKARLDREKAKKGKKKATKK